jgi:hypothetical protein
LNTGLASADPSQQTLLTMPQPDRQKIALHLTSGAMSGAGHKPPPSFVIGATGPPSIADDFPGMCQIVANVESHPRQTAAGAPEKPAAVAGGCGFGHGPED